MRRLLLATAVLLGLGLLAGGWAFAGFLAATSAVPERTIRPTDAIVVLTGGAERVETALRLLEQGAAPRLLVTGAASGLTLAELARAHGRDPAALAGRVTLGHAAATTLGNAAETAAYARARRLRSLRVVTAGYHMPRAMLELGRALPDLLLVAHPVTPAGLRPSPAGLRPSPAAPRPATEGGGLTGWRRWTLLSGEFVKYVAAAAGLTRFVPARESARP